jgi:hypothetical protein
MNLTGHPGLRRPIAQTVFLANVPTEQKPKKMAPVKGPSLLVIPVSAFLDDHRSLAAVLIPATMQAAIMTIELGA